MMARLWAFSPAVTAIAAGCYVNKEAREMPLFMDIHEHVDGLTAEAVAEAHRRDLETQGQHGVKYHRYWFNDETGQVFCLVEAPSKEAAETVHRDAHGLLADRIIEVKEGI